MVARDEDNFTLEEVLKKGQYISKLMHLLLFVMGVVDMVTVDDISTH
jgi:hypothetical protein